MTRTRRLLVLAALALPLGACGWFDDRGEPSTDTRNQQLYVEVVDVNGREVPCVVYDSNRDAGSVDCDWGAE